MKTFKVEGWYRYYDYDEKDFVSLVIRIDTAERAIEFFKDTYRRLSFYNIDIEEI